MIEKKKRKIVSLSPTERLQEMVEEIKSQLGLSTVSDVYFNAVTEMYRKLFPIYMGKRGIVADSLDPEEVAKRKIAIQSAEKKVKEDAIDEERAMICINTLHGSIEEEGESKYCVFNTYNFDTPDRQRVPLEMVNKDFASHQKVVPTISKK